MVRVGCIINIAVLEGTFRWANELASGLQATVDDRRRRRRLETMRLRKQWGEAYRICYDQALATLNERPAKFIRCRFRSRLMKAAET